MRVAVYMRVSTAGQAREGVSLDTQEQLARDRCSALGWTLSHSYTDVMSGRKDDRPELARLMADAAAGRFDAVMVYRLDRLGRSLVRTLQVVGELADAGVRLISLTQAFEIDGSLGKLLLSIYASFAEMESEAIGARVRDARRQRLQLEGRHYATPPFGYKREDGKLVIDEGAAAHVRAAFEAVAAGQSVRSVVVSLNERGIRTATGRVWSQAGLKVVLGNPTYKGLVTHGRKTLKRTSKGEVKRQVLEHGAYLSVDGEHAPLISAELWEAANRHIDARKGTHPRTVASGERHPWVGVSRCGVCGSRLTAHMKREHVQFSCARKGHSGPTACTLSGISLSLLSGALVRAMALPLAQGVTASGKRSKKPAAESLDRRRELAKTEAAISRESDLYRMGAQNLTQTETRIKELKAKMTSLSEATPVTAIAPPKIDNFIELWRGLSRHDQAALVRSLVDSVTLEADAIALAWRPEFRAHLGDGLRVERPRLKGSAVTAYAL